MSAFAKLAESLRVASNTPAPAESTNENAEASQEQTAEVAANEATETEASEASQEQQEEKGGEKARDKPEIFSKDDVQKMIADAIRADREQTQAKAKENDCPLSLRNV